MTFDHFKIRGTGEALVDVHDLLRVQLNIHNVQRFDTLVGRSTTVHNKSSRARYIGTCVQTQLPFSQRN